MIYLTKIESVSIELSGGATYTPGLNKVYLECGGCGSPTPICDLGDIRGGEKYEDWINAIEHVVSRVSNDGKTPILIGGEHSIAQGAIRALKPDLVISFDAHMDLRDQLFNESLSHATFMRRSLEEHDFRLNIIG